jgi:integrase
VREKTRHGKFVWYVRRRTGGPRIRLRAEFGTPEFQAEYEAALKGTPLRTENRAHSGSLRWLCEQYRQTGAWMRLSAATRRQRENIFEGVLKIAGDEPFTNIRHKHIEAGKDRRRATPSQARNFLDAMRGLFRWALAAEHVKADPTASVANPVRQAGSGFPVWTEDDVTRYEAAWPVGTRQRVWLHVLLYTGLRRGDAVRLGRQHVRGGVATIKTEKSGFTVEVNLPILPTLAATLAAGPCADLAFICGERGEPLTKESFGNNFSDACRAAGIKKSAHGVRKIGATRAADNGATVAELEAIFGWQGGMMAALYTRAADRKRLAKGAMGKLERTQDKHSMPAPGRKVRAENPSIE